MFFSETSNRLSRPYKFAVHLRWYEVVSVWQADKQLLFTKFKPVYQIKMTGGHPKTINWPLSTLRAWVNSSIVWEFLTERFRETVALVTSFNKKLDWIQRTNTTFFASSQRQLYRAILDSWRIVLIYFISQISFLTFLLYIF